MNMSSQKQYQIKSAKRTPETIWYRTARGSERVKGSGQDIREPSTKMPLLVRAPIHCDFPANDASLTEPLAVASGSLRAKEFFSPMTYDPVATAPGSVTFLSPEALGYFQIVGFADVDEKCLMNNPDQGLKKQENATAFARTRFLNTRGKSKDAIPKACWSWGWFRHFRFVRDLRQRLPPVGQRPERLQQ